MKQTSNEKDPHDVLSVLEPSCGAGGMLVAAAERLQQLNINYSYNSLMYAVDVDERCVAMSSNNRYNTNTNLNNLLCSKGK